MLFQKIRHPKCQWQGYRPTAYEQRFVRNVERKVVLTERIKTENSIQVVTIRDDSVVIAHRNIPYSYFVSAGNSVVPRYVIDDCDRSGPRHFRAKDCYVGPGIEQECERSSPVDKNSHVRRPIMAKPVRTRKANPGGIGRQSYRSRAHQVLAVNTLRDFGGQTIGRNDGHKQQPPTERT